MKSRKIPPSDFETLLPLLIGVWRRFHKLGGPGDKLQTREFRSVVAAVQALKKGLETGGELLGEDYFSKPELLGAYLLYQWIIHYQQGLSLINEVPFIPRRVLDIGSGPAPFAFAALRHGASEVIAVDRNATALQLGAEICGRYGLPLSIRQQDCVKTPLAIEGKFDLIIVAHCLEEMFPDTQKNARERQKTYIDHLLTLLTPQGCLLLVEDSWLPANQRLLSLRDQLVGEGVPVQAPCVWRGECPALKAKNSPCYAQREWEKPFIIKEIQRAAQINLGSLKMSYVIFRNKASGWPALPSEPLYRIISPPVEFHQSLRYYLCGTDGKKSLGSHLKQHPAASRAFDYLQRGALISVEDALVTSHGYDIVEGTKVRIEAAPGKPLPEEKTDETDYA